MAYALTKYVVFAVNPVMLLVNAPVPVPSTVLVANAIVGLAVVLQQIPLAVMVAPPSEVMFPPLVAVVVVMPLIVFVVTVGKLVNVVNVCCVP